MSTDKTPDHRDDEDMLPEYDFSGKTGVRGKYYQRMRDGYAIRVHQIDGTTTIQHITRPEGSILLDRDVQAYFPDAEAVNTALRALIQLIPNKKPRKKATQSARKQSPT
ncbi:hypothetical protein [Candidatus Chloroploca sp. Khr17]|uniref:hypothetical protein n=1 Tax=Candidatus Chloroploca sp. Khr17 TaxID=2496869 RepID=UPI001F0DA01C|nr:hypothetical protein [Candidatus Chloroploca sp. Khr17]